MAKTLKVEIASPDRQVYDGEAEMVVAPGAEGEFGVLPRHAHLMATLKPGELRLTVAGKVKRYAVSSGFLEVTPRKVLVLADAAEPEGEINVDRAKRALERARKRVKAGKGAEVDFGRARFALMRAINRLRVTKGK